MMGIWLKRLKDPGKVMTYLAIMKISSLLPYCCSRAVCLHTRENLPGFFLLFIDIVP